MTPDLEAAKRLGVMDELMAATGVPDEARAAANLGKPDAFVLIVDGRECHGDTIAVWLGERTTTRKVKIISRAVSLPRRSMDRPYIYAEAERLGIERIVITRPNMSKLVERPRAYAPDTTGPDLTGLVLTTDAK